MVHATADYICETRWGIAGYASLEPGAAVENPKWRSLIQEFTDFVADVPPMRTVMMKGASDVTILRDEDA